MTVAVLRGRRGGGDERRGRDVRRGTATEGSRGCSRHRRICCKRSTLYWVGGGEIEGRSELKESVVDGDAASVCRCRKEGGLVAFDDEQELIQPR